MVTCQINICQDSVSEIVINPSLDVVNINAFAKFGQIPSICSQDIERKRNSKSMKGHKCY